VLADGTPLGLDGLTGMANLALKLCPGLVFGLRLVAVR
jgi:hypothetical protein